MSTSSHTRWGLALCSALLPGFVATAATAGDDQAIYRGMSRIIVDARPTHRLMWYGGELVMIEAPVGTFETSELWCPRSPREGVLQIFGSPKGTFGLSYEPADDGHAFSWSDKPEGSEWEKERPADGKFGFYLKAAHGKHKGWYLDFEKEPQEEFRPYAAVKFVKIWKAKLSPKPGSMSNISTKSINLK